MTNNDGNILLALLTGAAIGAGIGILYAPDKGIETRHKIKQKVGEKAQQQNRKNLPCQGRAYQNCQ